MRIWVRGRPRNPTPETRCLWRTVTRARPQWMGSLGERRHSLSARRRSALADRYRPAARACAAVVGPRTGTERSPAPSPKPVHQHVPPTAAASDRRQHVCPPWSPIGGDPIAGAGPDGRGATNMRRTASAACAPASATRLGVGLPRREVMAPVYLLEYRLAAESAESPGAGRSCLVDGHERVGSLRTDAAACGRAHRMRSEDTEVCSDGDGGHDRTSNAAYLRRATPCARAGTLAGNRFDVRPPARSGRPPALISRRPLMAHRLS